MKFIFLYFLIFNLIINPLYCSFQHLLFIETNKQFKGKNFIISPLNIFQALSLVTNGAKSLTLKEMLKTLQSSDISELNEINFDLLETIKNFLTVEIANAVMLREFTPKKNFMEISKKYLAPTCELESVEQVNKWCIEKTHGKITKILDELNDDTVMIILNAIYFKGKWLYEFEKSDTIKDIFYNLGLGENEIMVDMMTQKTRFNYYEEEGMQVIELPYKEDSMSAVIILPPEDININDFIETIDINDIIGQLASEEVYLQFPKFELDFTVNFNEILEGLGMKSAFSDNADFSGLKEEKDIKINEIIQKVYIKVDEEGTEAAAVTVNRGGGMLSFPGFYEMIVNRPFLFLLRNNDFPEGHDLLFMSKIEELSKM